jgi:hypothetical protein
MKKLIFLFVLVSFVWVAKAAGELDFVCVNGVTYFSEDIKIGVSNARITTENGMTLKAPLSKVDAYRIDGKLFERLPLICADGKNKGTALMELITQHNGLRLYKFHPGSQEAPANCCFNDKTNAQCVYFVYKEGQLYLHVNHDNAPTVFPFFHVKYSSNS